MEQNLLNYIKENLDKGVSQEQIRQSLITSGWQSADIDAAFNQLQSPQPITPPIYQPISSKPSFNLKLLLIGILVLILLASAGGGVYFYMSNIKKDNSTSATGTQQKSGTSQEPSTESKKTLQWER